MSNSLTTLFAILMTENPLPKTNYMTNPSFTPKLTKHFNNVPRSYTNKDMRRNHQIKQPGYDVQRKHVTLGNHSHRKR